jgi:uncharacterized protein involved in response to NO
LAVLLLLVASGWWALVQLDRVGWGLGLIPTLSPSVTHAAVMTFGFMPLFFAGFLFTAGPKWLGLSGPPARQMVWPLLLQLVGWVAWLAGAQVASHLALAGASMAVVGLVWMYGRFWQLVWASPAADKLHAQAVGWAGVAGVVSLLALVVATALDRIDLALAFAQTGLWGFVVVTFVAVLHRMLPFFTSSALPFIDAWRPFWVFWFLLGVVGMELAAVWIPLWTTGPAFEGAKSPRVWMLVLGLGELAAGSVVAWLAVVWGLVQSLKIRLLAMLHLGFLWLSLALILSGASQLLGLRAGVPVLGLGALHALTMGFLGSLMLAMVTRVSCGHSGRTLVADNLVWTLFWALQVAVLLRIASALPTMPGWGLALAACLWTLLMSAWGLRLMNWYGRPRADGRPD